jgi:hypothetical protein
MMSQTNMEHLLEQRSRMSRPLACLGCAAIALLLLSCLALIVWAYFFEETPDMYEVVLQLLLL